MRVLAVGATGNLGSRVLSALILRGHTTFAFVRDPLKLPVAIRDQVAGIEKGDAKVASDIKTAAIRNQCDAIVNTAGYAAMEPWRTSDLPVIVDAVIQAAVEIGADRGSPLRVWLLAGQGILDIPTQKHMIVDYMHVFPEHRLTWDKLRSLPRSSMDWSLLCPAPMYPLAKATYPVPSAASADNLVAARDICPEWTTRFLCIPLIGGYLNIMSQVLAYKIPLEDTADFIAKDVLQGPNSPWIFQKVGLKLKGK